MSNRILVSFQYNVAALIDRRILLIHTAVCEEIFQAMTEIKAKDLAVEQPELVEAHPAAIAGQLRDFPLLLKVVSLADGVEILSPPEIMVKWSNIAAICNLSDEQWTVIKKPPRKQRRKAVTQ